MIWGFYAQYMSGGNADQFMDITGAFVIIDNSRDIQY
jgi:hypothetical protein